MLTAAPLHPLNFETLRPAESVRLPEWEENDVEHSCHDRAVPGASITFTNVIPSH